MMCLLYITINPWKGRAELSWMVGQLLDKYTCWIHQMKFCHLYCRRTFWKVNRTLLQLFMVIFLWVNWKKYFFKARHLLGPINHIFIWDFRTSQPTMNLWFFDKFYRFFPFIRVLFQNNFRFILRVSHPILSFLSISWIIFFYHFSKYHFSRHHVFQGCQ